MSTNDQGLAPTIFHKFSHLPKELRLQIWSESHTPAIVPLMLTEPGVTRTPRVQSPALRIPPLLHVNQESRDFWIKKYRSTLDQNIRYRYFTLITLDPSQEDAKAYLETHRCELLDRTSFGQPFHCCHSDVPGGGARTVMCAEYSAWYDIEAVGRGDHRSFWTPAHDVVFLSSTPDQVTREGMGCETWWSLCDFEFKGVKNVAIGYRAFTQERDRGSVTWKGLERLFLLVPRENELKRKLHGDFPGLANFRQRDCERMARELWDVDISTVEVILVDCLDEILAQTRRA
ncbi:hypothetical protein LZ554_007780 [Drepanopeziza brunnea f. sp. 'monogermtubi']|nr:hypothetical protein LZ554_007780 [Drepanopeziza brunnea f. sp. 'monogermtubi']